MKKKILCMFSGGLDSCGLLHLLLTDKQYQNYDIHVHHIKIINITRRAKAETVATDDILDYCKQHYRPFSVTRSMYQGTELGRAFLNDNNIVTHIAACIVNVDDSYEYVTTGITKSEMEREATRIRQKNAKDLFNLMVTQGKRTKPVELLWPLLDLTKREIYNMIPQYMRDNYWSCRLPKYINGVPHECRKCPSCMHLIEEEILHS